MMPAPNAPDGIGAFLKRFKGETFIIETSHQLADAVRHMAARIPADALPAPVLPPVPQPVPQSLPNRHIEDPRVDATLRRRGVPIELPRSGEENGFKTDWLTH
jgi:hypothetical protein